VASAKQEAEAGVGKLLCPLVYDGFETEPFEEYGKRWTSHTAAYDDNFGHLRFLSHVSAFRFKFRGKECSRTFFWERGREIEKMGEVRILKE
jgi:hypothetical protein